MITRASGRPIFYDVVGGGSSTPLLFMHGGLGLDHTYFRPGVDPLALGRRLIFYDHYGNGRSRGSGATNISGTLEALCADADAIRREAANGPVTVLAHSFGCCVAVQYALSHPDSVRALILCGGVASVAFGPALMAAIAAHGTPAQLDVYQRAFSGSIRTDQEFRDGWLTVFPLYFNRYRDEYGRQMAAGTAFSAEGFNRFAAEALPAYAPDFDALKTPTLILTGRHDHLIAPEHGGARLHREIRGSQLHTFEASGHFPFIEEADAFVAVVSAWLASLEP